MAPPQTSPSGRGTAVVTGAARGIGAAVSARLLSDGHRVVMVDVAPQVGDAAARLGPAAVAACFDVTDARAWDAALAELDDPRAPLRTLVACAGTLGRSRPVTALELSEWRSVVDVNLTGVFVSFRAVTPRIVAAGGGSVVAIASIAGKEGNAGQAAYSAAKGGVIALVKSLAKEVASDGVSVNCVAPTVVEGPFADAMADEARTAIRAKIPMGRFGQPEEVAAMVSWICSAECTFTTGFCFDLSGGRATY